MGQLDWWFLEADAQPISDPFFRQVRQPQPASATCQPNPTQPKYTSFLLNTGSHFQFLQPWWRCFKLLKTSPSIPKTFQKKRSQKPFKKKRFLQISNHSPWNFPIYHQIYPRKKKGYLQALTLSIPSIPHAIHNLTPKEIPLFSAKLLLSTHHRSISAADHYLLPPMILFIAAKSSTFTLFLDFNPLLPEKESILFSSCKMLETFGWGNWIFFVVISRMNRITSPS